LVKQGGKGDPTQPFRKNGKKNCDEGKIQEPLEEGSQHRGKLKKGWMNAERYRLISKSAIPAAFRRKKKKQKKKAFLSESARLPKKEGLYFVSGPLKEKDGLRFHRRWIRRRHKGCWHARKKKGLTIYLRAREQGLHKKKKKKEGVLDVLFVEAELGQREGGKNCVHYE